jgi:hypothetical protein
MKLTPPKNITFWVAIVLGLLGFIGNFTAIRFVSGYAFWFVFVGFALLALGNLLKGL